MASASVGAVVVALALALGCAKAPPPRCAGEGTEVQRDTRVQITTLANPKDPTSGGRLHEAALTGARPMRAVLLLDYSGSMWGGYDKPQQTSCAICKGYASKRSGQPYHYGTPEFRALVANLVRATSPKGADISMRALLFNHDLWRFDGGKLVKLPMTTSSASLTTPALDFPWKLSTMSDDDVARALGEIPPDPFKSTGMSANETYMQPALATAVDAILRDGDEGIVWFVTDNIADHTGGAVSPEDARQNLEFYQFLDGDPRLQLVYAYPLHDASTCTWLCASSLFAYAIHVSKRERAGVDEANRISGGHLGEGAAKEDGLLWNAKLQALTAEHAGASTTELAGVPLRLKPMDLNAVSVSFLKAKSGKLEPIRCKRTSEFGQVTPCVATVVVKNNLRHERVDSAVLAFENQVLLPHSKDDPKRIAWASSVCTGQIKMRAKDEKRISADGRFPVGPLDPGAEQRLDVVMLVPAVQVAATSVVQIVDVALTDAMLLEGKITASVTDVKTSLVVPPEDRARVYGAENLPQIFVSRNESEVQAIFPAVVPVNNDGKVQALLLLALVVAGVILCLLALFIFQPAYVTVLVDGVEADRLRMRRLSSQKVEVRGVRLGAVRRGAGLPTFVPAKGSTAKRQGTGWIVAPPGGGGLEQRIELRHGWKSKAKASPAAGGF